MIRNISLKSCITSIKLVYQASSGHTTSSTSCCDILSVLYFHANGMNINYEQPKSIDSDRLVLSKGHGCPGLYAIWKEIGQHVTQELLDNFRQENS